jgi:hypothetical protein
VEGHIFVANGDLTQLTAHALAYSTSTGLQGDGNLYPAFARHVPEFPALYAALPRPGRLGDAFWLPLPGDRPPYGVVVVVAAGGSRTVSREDKARVAVRSALETAIARLRTFRPEPERLLIALPTFRHGMGGDRHFRLESARWQIATARDVLADHPAVDVAFVPYTADSYRIFLQARRDLRLEPACPVQAPALPALLSALRERRCVLFVGAGVSAGAGLPGWDKLIDRLAAELGVSLGGRGDLDFYLDLAQWYVEKQGPKALPALLAGLFAGSPARPTLAHYLLMSLPVRLVVTTNYDDLLERTLTALRRHPRTVVEEKDVALTGRGEAVCVVKLHGDAARAQEIVLARDDYDGFFRRRPAMALLLEGLLLNQTFLFAGYGLKDPNFRQVYSRIADMLQGADRQAFALTVEAAGETWPLLAGQWGRKGLHLLAMPGEAAADRVRASVRFLDWLADEATLHAQDLFLAPDVDGQGPLEPLRQKLIEGVGREVERGVLGPLDQRDARQLAEVLGFLTDHGWRPSADSALPLWKLWERLADAFPDAAGKRRMLITSLRFTERLSDDEHIRKRLEAIAEEAR